MASQSQQLLNLALSGGLSDVGQLLCLHAQYLRAIANSQLDRRLRRRVSPSDLVQETLLEAHRDFASFRGATTAELIGWLRRILINNLISISEQHLKSEKRDIRREISLQRLAERGLSSQVGIDLQAECHSPSAMVRGQEESSELITAMNMLSSDQRQVVVLRHVEGLPFSEIATRMERTSGACRMLWLRAVEQLRHALQERQS